MVNNPCGSNPCSNNADCTEVTYRNRVEYQCACQPGYTGEFCDNVIGKNGGV